jgi:cell wall-associated NlpC family hydrolase
VPLLCAIACREAGLYWLPLTPHKSAAEILGLSIYDASGDVAGAPRSAFPKNTTQFRQVYGDGFTSMLIDEANKARAVRGLNPASIVYKGYGIFQYDLQFVKTDESFFRERKWYNFSECVSRAVKELKHKFDVTGDIHDAVRAYNGSGPKAEQYARDVMRLLPFCQEAASDATDLVFPTTQSDLNLASAGYPEGGSGSAPDDDPALPQDGELNETADFETARLIANLALSTTDQPSSGAMTFTASAPFSFDLARAKAFLQACQTSHPRVTYGLGKKVPFHGAVPGRDFTKVDCSGFVREAIRLATNQPFPDGSVVQHDWIRDHGFEKSTILAGANNDDMVRIAFLRPQDAASHVGHVVLIAGGRTLESHSQVGPDSREWNGRAWQAKAFVYVLARNVRSSALHGGATIEAAPALATSFTVHHGRRYRAKILLTGLEQLAGNGQVSDKFTELGFADVIVKGSGSTRQAEGTWTGTDTTVQLDSHIASVVEIPVPAIAANGNGAAVMTAPAIIPGRENAMGSISPTIFSTEQLPTHHENLLVVKMRPESMMAVPAMALSASPVEPSTTGLSALSFYERAGQIKRIVHLRKRGRGAAPLPQLSAASTMMYSSRPIQEADASTGVRFIELEQGLDAQQLHTALANDPSVHSVSRVPIRYLTGRVASRSTAPRVKIGIEATPPDVSILWNLKKIFWEEARDQAGFHEARDVRVAVLDTGVDDQHPDLMIDAYHWQQPDLSRPVSDKDIIGHGTHVSGTIGALINSGAAVKGICNCRLSVWKIFDDEPTYAPALGAFVYFVNPITYRRALAACVEDPVDVINLSIGGPSVPDAVEQSLFSQLMAAGVTICAAMGNERQQGSPPSYPAAIPGVIAVGATGIDDRVTVFSNSGNHIAVAAPGKAIWSTLPTYSGQSGFGAVIGPNGTAIQGKPRRREMNYDAWDGTSMATPHVSGCAALLIAKSNAAGNKLAPEQVKQLLMESADKVSAMNGANFSTDYGAGRINLLKLLQWVAGE